MITTMTMKEIKEELDGLSVDDTLCFNGTPQPNTLRIEDSPVSDGDTLTINDCS